MRLQLATRVTGEVYIEVDVKCQVRLRVRFCVEARWVSISEHVHTRSVRGTAYNLHAIVQQLQFASASASGTTS